MGPTVYRANSQFELVNRVLHGEGSFIRRRQDVLMSKISQVVFLTLEVWWRVQDMTLNDKAQEKCCPTPSEPKTTK